MIRTISIAIALASVFMTALSQAQDDVKIQTHTVTQQIYMLEGKGGNIGVFLGKDGTFVVDDQFAPLSEKILKAIQALGGDVPKFLINTHFHGDHTGGNEHFGKAGALIVAHHNVRERLVNGSFIAAFKMKAEPGAKVALPVLTFSESMHFHINDESVEAHHVPRAHTDGDSFIHFKNSNVVHAGDLFFNGFYPFIDAAHGGSVKGMIAGVDKILAMTDANSKIIPGHGPLADKAQLQAFRDMLATAYSRLLKLKNSGVTAEDAVAAQPLADLEAAWGDGFLTGDRWISIVYPAVF
jgi:cyclase